MQRLQEETKIRTALEDQVTTKPEKLTDLAHWPKFWEQLKTYTYPNVVEQCTYPECTLLGIMML
jgi:hypothetical protein